MCYTSEQVIDEAIIAKEAGNMPLYAKCTQILMNEFDMTVEQIRLRIDESPVGLDAICIPPKRAGASLSSPAAA